MPPLHWVISHQGSMSVQQVIQRNLSGLCNGSHKPFHRPGRGDHRHRRRIRSGSVQGSCVVIDTGVEVLDLGGRHRLGAQQQPSEGTQIGSVACIQDCDRPCRRIELARNTGWDGQVHRRERRRDCHDDRAHQAVGTRAGALGLLPWTLFSRHGGNGDHGTTLALFRIISSIQEYGHHCS